MSTAQVANKITIRSISIYVPNDPNITGFLNDVLVDIVEEIRCPIVIRSREDDIQSDVERLPGMAHGNGVAIEPIQFLYTLEAVIDEEGLGS